MRPAGATPRAEAPARAAAWAVGGLLLLLPLFPPETRGESFAGCGTIVVLLAALAAGAGMPRTGAWALAAAFAAAWPLGRAAAAPGASVEPLATWLLGGAAGVAAAAFARPLAADRKVLLVLAAAGGIGGAHALYQWAWGLEAAARAIAEGRLLVADRETVLARLAEGRAYAAFATPAALGGFLALSLPVTIGLALERAGRLRAALLLAAALEVGGLLACRSVTAAAALALSYLVAAVRRTGSARAGVLLVGSAALALAIVGLRSGQVLSVSRPDSPWRQRAGNFRIACQIARESPWLGAGPGGYGETFPRFRREGDNESRHAHNLALELAAEVGIPLGGLLSAAFYALLAGPLLGGKSRSGAALAGLDIGLCALALQNLGDFSALYPSLLWTAALLRGLSHADGNAQSPRAGPAVAAPLVAAAIAAATVAGLAGLSWNARVRAREEAAAGRAEQAAEAARRAVLLAPWNPDARLFHAEALAQLARSRTGGAALAEALSAAEAAVASSPIRPAARDVRASLRLVAGDLPGAYADWAEAARLYPARREYAIRRDELARKLPWLPREAAR